MKYDFMKMATARVPELTPFEEYCGDIKDILFIEDLSVASSFIKGDMTDRIIDEVLDLFPSMTDDQEISVIGMLSGLFEGIQALHMDMWEDLGRKKNFNPNSAMQTIQTSLNRTMTEVSAVLSEAVLSLEDQRIELKNCRLNISDLKI